MSVSAFRSSGPSVASRNASLVAEMRRRKKLEMEFMASYSRMCDRQRATEDLLDDIDTAKEELRRLKLKCRKMRRFSHHEELLKRIQACLTLHDVVKVPSRLRVHIVRVLGVDPASPVAKKTPSADGSNYSDIALFSPSSATFARDMDKYATFSCSPSQWKQKDADVKSPPGKEASSEPVVAVEDQGANFLHREILRRAKTYHSSDLFYTSAFPVSVKDAKRDLKSILKSVVRHHEQLSRSSRRRGAVLSPLSARSTSSPMSSRTSTPFSDPFTPSGVPSPRIFDGSHPEMTPMSPLKSFSGRTVLSERALPLLPPLAQWLFVVVEIANILHLRPVKPRVWKEKPIVKTKTTKTTTVPPEDDKTPPDHKIQIEMNLLGTAIHGLFDSSDSSDVEEEEEEEEGSKELQWLPSLPEVKVETEVEGETVAKTLDMDMDMDSMPEYDSSSSVEDEGEGESEDGDNSDGGGLGLGYVGIFG